MNSVFSPAADLISSEDHLSDEWCGEAVGEAWNDCAGFGEAGHLLRELGEIGGDVIFTFMRKSTD